MTAERRFPGAPPGATRPAAPDEPGVNGAGGLLAMADGGPKGDAVGVEAGGPVDLVDRNVATIMLTLSVVPRSRANLSRLAAKSSAERPAAC